MISNSIHAKICLQTSNLSFSSSSISTRVHYFQSLPSLFLLGVQLPLSHFLPISLLNTSDTNGIYGSYCKLRTEFLRSDLWPKNEAREP